MQSSLFITKHMFTQKNQKNFLYSSLMVTVKRKIKVYYLHFDTLGLKKNGYNIN